MTVRPEPTIRAETERWKREQVANRNAGRMIDALLCSTIVSVLAWVLEEADKPTTRIKV